MFLWRLTMCGRFRLDISPKQIESFYNTLKSVDQHYKRYDSWFQNPQDRHPGSTAVILTKEGIQEQTWGFPFHKRLVFNARSESLHEKQMFYPLLENNRCIIPATTFFEWSEKRKFNISTHDSYFFMAGLWRPEITEHGITHRFVILTTQANHEMENIHNRMPVIIDSSSMRDYLNPLNSFEDLAELLIPWNHGLSIELALGEQLSLLD